MYFFLIPAREIEAPVVALIESLLSNPEAIAAVVRHWQAQGSGIVEAKAVMAAMGRLLAVCCQLFPAEQHRIVNLVIRHIDLVQAKGYWCTPWDERALDLSCLLKAASYRHWTITQRFWHRSHQRVHHSVVN